MQKYTEMGNSIIYVMIHEHLMIMTQFNETLLTSLLHPFSLPDYYDVLLPQ